MIFDTAEIKRESVNKKFESILNKYTIKYKNIKFV